MPTLPNKGIAGRSREWEVFMRNVKRRIATILTVVVLATIASFVAAPGALAVPGGGNQSCPDGYVLVKVDRAPILGEVVTDGVLSVTITNVYYKVDDSNEVYGFDYSSNLPVLTIVKGGPNSNLYSMMRTTHLDTILGPGGRHYGISWFGFCYVPPV
jgi:hypothetical protein